MFIFQRKYSTQQTRGALVIAWAVCMALLVALVTYASILLHRNQAPSVTPQTLPESRAQTLSSITATASTASIISSQRTSTLPMLGHSVSPESASYTWGVLVSTLVYTLFAAMHGLTTLLKEKAIIEYGEPVDIYQLSVWLFSYQTGFGILFSPLLYFLQGVTVGVPLGFPLSAYLANVRDGLGCLVGARLTQSQFDDFIISTDDASSAAAAAGNRILTTVTFLAAGNSNSNSIIQDHTSRFLADSSSSGTTDTTNQLYDMRGSDQCSEYTLVYVILYVVSTVAIIECMGRLLQGQSASLSRVLLATVLLSCVVLGVYDALVGQGDGWFHSHFSLLDVAVVAVLMVGLELYGRDPEPDIEIKTHVPFSTTP